MYATTSKFAILTGVTTKALRLYERRGLLKPRRTRAGYRRYTYSDMLRLERILALKALGLPLKEIAMVTHGGGKSLDLLRRQRALLDERRQRLDRAVKAIDAITADAQPGDALHRFVGQSSWDRWEARRHEFPPAVQRAPDRASPSRVELFKRIHDALQRDPEGNAARPLVKQWNALLQREAGDELMAEAKKKRWAGRTQWPDGMRKYVASLYDMEPDAWERVAAFIERTQG
jgi:DNA-binding transcriptional MerR regulator